LTIFFPDISSYQSGLDLSGALAVTAKATQGTGYVNPVYGAFKAEAAKHGACFVAYHFLEAGDGGGQAQACYRQAGKTPVMLDFEPSGTSRPTLSDATSFVDAYRKLGGACWLVYLPRWYWGSSPINSASLKPLTDRGLLLVSSDYVPYTDAASGAGWQAYGGMTPTVWQYTSGLSFNAHSVDFNAYRGTHAGDQSPSAVADTLRQYGSIVATGKLPVVAAPAKVPATPAKPVTVAPKPAPPILVSAPTGPVAQVTGVTLKWNKVTGYESYHLVVWLKGVKAPSVVALNVTGTSYVVDGLKPKTAYGWYVSVNAPAGVKLAPTPSQFFSTP
jgi:hypothetical protein